MDAGDVHRGRRRGELDTARSIMKRSEDRIDACAAYIKFNRDQKGTDWDPIYVACAYNAGGLYENKGALNRWKLRQYPIGTGNHADRFAAYFSSARQLVEGGLFKGRNAVTFRTLGLV